MQYNSAAFPVAATKTEVVFPPQETLDVDKLQVEPSQPELPVVSNTQIPGDIGQKTENSLSQSAEFISDIDTLSYPLQPENIPSVLAELNTNPRETPAISVSPQQESGKVQNNPHAIFDRMGKNMSYATTFNLGTIELEQLFDEFDRTLDREEQVNRDDSLSQAQGNLELEQRFDEFDRTLELEEQVNKGDSVFQAQGDLELEQRFNEFDRTLEQQEKGQTPIEPTPQTKSPSQLISEKADAQIQERGNTEKEEAGKITSKLATDGIQNQNQQYVIAPLASRQVELVHPLSHATKLHLNTLPKFDFKLEALLFHTGINLISLILWLLNLIRRNQIPLQPDINSQLILSVIPYGDRIKNELENPNSQVIDIRQNDFTDGILPLILSSQQSSHLTTSTSVDASTPSRDSLTGMFYGEFTGHNSYPLTDDSNVIKAENKSNHNKANLHEKPCHAPKEGKNDSS